MSLARRARCPPNWEWWSGRESNPRISPAKRVLTAPTAAPLLAGLSLESPPEPEHRMRHNGGASLSRRFTFCGVHQRREVAALPNKKRGEPLSATHPGKLPEREDGFHQSLPKPRGRSADCAS